MSTQRNLIALAVVVGFATLVVLASKYNEKRFHGLPENLGRQVKTLVVKSLQYNAEAQQDDNPIFSLLHTNYALSFLSVARTIASDDQIQKLVKVNPANLYQQLILAQQGALYALASYCTGTSASPTPQPQQQQQQQQQL